MSAGDPALKCDIVKADWSQTGIYTSLCDKHIVTCLIFNPYIVLTLC